MTRRTAPVPYRKNSTNREVISRPNAENLPIDIPGQDAYNDENSLTKGNEGDSRLQGTPQRSGEGASPEEVPGDSKITPEPQAEQAQPK